MAVAVKGRKRDSNKSIFCSCSCSYYSGLNPFLLLPCSLQYHNTANGTKVGQGYQSHPKLPFNRNSPAPLAPCSPTSIIILLGGADVLTSAARDSNTVMAQRHD
jgi:hypothetical protein